MRLLPDALGAVGGTSLVPLRAIGEDLGVRILLKVESENPTGSMKDRMALAMITAAERGGRLKDGQPVVEYTGGSTGVSLAFVCAVQGRPIHIVTSDAFSKEKLDHMAALGATLDVLPSDGGRMTGQLTRDMVERARVLAHRTGAFWTDQLANEDQLQAYHGMAEEIWDQTDGQVDAWVQSVGTCGSLRGVAEGLRAQREGVRVVAVEPDESAVLSGGQSGAHKIDGIGAGYVVPLWRPELVDRIERVSTGDALAMARRLGREEGLFAGTSTGANVVAALRVARDLDAGATIVTVLCDTGMKYLSNPAYQR